MGTFPGGNFVNCCNIGWHLCTIFLFFVLFFFCPGTKNYCSNATVYKIE